MEYFSYIKKNYVRIHTHIHLPKHIYIRRANTNIYCHTNEHVHDIQYSNQQMHSIKYNSQYQLVHVFALECHLQGLY